MSSRRSEARKIIRRANRLQKKQAAARDKHRKPGETDEEMEARMKRDLSSWLDMMTEREVETGLMAEVERQTALERLQSIEVSEDDIVVSDEEKKEK